MSNFDWLEDLIATANSLLLKVNSINLIYLELHPPKRLLKSRHPQCLIYRNCKFAFAKILKFIRVNIHADTHCKFKGVVILHNIYGLKFISGCTLPVLITLVEMFFSDIFDKFTLSVHHTDRVIVFFLFLFGVSAQNITFQLLS